MFGCVKMTEKRNLGQNAKKNSQLGWNCFKKILIMFFITICLLKVKKMTRLSHIPFAKSFLAISLSAVFSGAVYAGVEQVTFTDDFVVTVNGEIQKELNQSEDLGSWWGAPAEMQGNVVEVKPNSTPEGTIASVQDKIIGGWSTSGLVQNNQVSITGIDKNILVEGGVYGGRVQNVGDATVTNNSVDLDSVLISDGNIYSGQASFVSSPNTRTDIQNNTVKISNAAVSGSINVNGAFVIGSYENLVIAKHNKVLIDDIESSNIEAMTTDSLRIASVRAAGFNIEASNNYVELNNAFLNSDLSNQRSDWVYGVELAGNTIRAEGNEVKLNNVVLSEVGGVLTTSFGDGSSSIVHDNRFVWHNQQDISVPLERLWVVNNHSDVRATTTNNYGEISGLNVVIRQFEDSEGYFLNSKIEGFVADGGDNGLAINSGNVLKIHQSQLFEVYGVRSSGNEVVVSSNQIDVTGTSDVKSKINQFAGFMGIGKARAEVTNNHLNVDYLKNRAFNAVIINADDAKATGNKISISNSILAGFEGIVSVGYGTSQASFSGNHIALENNFWTPDPLAEDSLLSERLTTTPTANMIIADAKESIHVTDNTFEVSGNKGLTSLVGVTVSGDTAIETVDISNNTLLVKDSEVDRIVGVEFMEGHLLANSGLTLQNNIIILDNVKVSGEVLSVSAPMTRSAVVSLSQSGKLILRGHNSAESVTGFKTFEFDLGTAENDTPMLTITGADTNTIKDQTFVLTNGDQASVDDITLINTQDSSMSLSAENVVLQVRDTFTFKSLDVNAVFDGDGFQLSDYYEELMRQKDQAGLGTLTLSDSQLATITLTRQSSEEALNLLQSAENLSTDAPVKGFASLSGSSNFYELGTGFDLNGTSLAVGGALRMNDNWSGVAFAQYSDANADSTVSGFRGDSDMKTYSAGVALRYQTEMPFYTEGAVVFGQADTDFVGSYTNDTARYNSDRFYTTAQLGIGSDIKLSDSVNLNVYGRYSFTYLDGDKVALNNATCDTFYIDETMVHAMRVGARVKGSVAPNVQWFAGAAFERVLDGDVESMVNDAKLQTETLKGNVGIFEVGATLAPNDLGPWTMDVKAGAYAGDRRGVSGSVSVNYVF